MLGVLAVVAGVGCKCLCCKDRNNMKDYTSYVNPFIGTAYNGHVFPGPCMPTGLVQPSPETGNLSWRYIGGYNYEDTEMWFFGQTHISGTGVPDLGDAAFIPFTGANDKKSYKSKFKKENESSEIGLYKVYLDDAKAQVNISSTNRVAIYDIKFDEDNGSLYFDFQSGICHKVIYPGRVKESEIKIVGDSEITGAQKVRMWVPRDVYFDIVFDKPIKASKVIKAVLPEKGDKYILNFGLKKGDTLKVKIAVSTVSVENARANMKAELDHWDFNKVVADNKTAWNKIFNKIQAEGTKDELTNFYTCMYHSFIHPSNITDVNGEYRGADNKVAKSKNGKYYSTLSLWDTYRAEHPLFTLIAPEYVNDFVNTMLDHYDVNGALPIWALWGKENTCMIGNHAIPVIAEAIVKGFDGFDKQRALNAMVDSSLKKLLKSWGEEQEKYGYYPYTLYKNESVSRTFELCYDDYAVAQVAKLLGDKKNYERFTKRSKFYQNLICPKTKLARARDDKGNWREPFDPMRLSHDSTIGGDYTEGNAYQYTWHVQHEPLELMKIMGGKEAFLKNLTALFENKEETVDQGGFTHDVTGLIGQYAHGNEPSHHVVYFYTIAGEHWKTAELVREIFDKFYQPKVDGLCGNDDCGQMSAWCIFSALGFYPVDPVSGEYIFGAPQLPKSVIALPDGKTFTVLAKGLSKENKYVKSIKLNGKTLNGISIKHSDIMAGGILEFEMTSKKK